MKRIFDFRIPNQNMAHKKTTSTTDEMDRKYVEPTLAICVCCVRHVTISIPRNRIYWYWQSHSWRTFLHADSSIWMTYELNISSALFLCVAGRSAHQFVCKNSDSHREYCMCRKKSFASKQNSHIFNKFLFKSHAHLFFICFFCSFSLFLSTLIEDLVLLTSLSAIIKNRVSCELIANVSSVQALFNTRCDPKC